jgi:hypothetical protein
MSLRVTLPRPPLSHLKFSDARLMRTIGQAMVGRIRSRTSSGQDADGRAFRALSPGYARQKRKALGHGRADLTVSGRMLNDMQAKPKPDGLSIVFRSGGAGGGGRTFIQRSRAVGAADKAAYHNLTGAGRSRVKREFFALSEDDEEFILDRVEDFIVRQF